MIEFDHVSVTYDGAEQPTLTDVTFTVPEGELCLVVGRTGSGKSTLLGAVNALVPRFTGGTLAGRVTVAGRDTAEFQPRDLADVVGVVAQDPLAGFVTDTVVEELAYGMEQLGIAPATMRKRVEEIIDVLGLADLRDRPLADLSGGQQQRVAIGSVLAVQPAVLVLDEPTSALDPTAAEEVLATITRLVHDLGLTVLMAEHRLERVVQYADSVAVLQGDGRVGYGDPATMLAHAPVAPPVVELGRLAGWDPLALSVRDARRSAAGLRDHLVGLPVPERRVDSGVQVAAPLSASRTAARPVPGPTSPVHTDSSSPVVAASGSNHSGVPHADHDDPILKAAGIVVRYGDMIAVGGVDLDLVAGEVVAIMGRNGSGKSSLLWALQGSGTRSAGRVVVGGSDPATLGATQARRLVGLVPQTASDLLYLDSVAGECTQGDRESGVAEGTTRALLDAVAPGIDGAQHPRDLSEGQKLALVLAIQLAASPRVMLLDEPTRGLDYTAKAGLGEAIASLADAGHSVVVATHDVEFVARVADRVLVMADGGVVADGPCAEVVVASPAYAPQVAKILRPELYLTVDQVRRALAHNDAAVREPDTTGAPR